jgi:hypothetical protein
VFFMMTMIHLRFSQAQVPRVAITKARRAITEREGLLFSNGKLAGYSGLPQKSP